MVTYKNWAILRKLVALVMLSAMVTLLVGRSVHTYIHSIHTCEHSADGDGEHNNHDCNICHSVLLLFDGVDAIVVAFIIALITTFLVGYIPRNTTVNILARTSRAPPRSII